jgi:hypothetical protein
MVSVLTTSLGWITAFCFWDRQGNCFHEPGQNTVAGITMPDMGQTTPVLLLGNGKTGFDSMQPMSGWWTYETSKYLIHKTHCASKLVKLADQL